MTKVFLLLPASHGRGLVAVDPLAVDAVQVDHSTGDVRVELRGGATVFVEPPEGEADPVEAICRRLTNVLHSPYAE